MRYNISRVPGAMFEKNERIIWTKHKVRDFFEILSSLLQWSDANSLKIITLIQKIAFRSVCVFN